MKISNLNLASSSLSTIEPLTEYSSRSAMDIIECTEERHSDLILAIFNHSIVNSTALFDYKPRTKLDMERWFTLKKEHHYPVIAAVDRSGNFLGFSSYGQFRNFPGYKYTVEHSLYVHHNHCGKGIGKLLLSRLIEYAKKQNYHAMIAAIEARNAPSIKLHEKLGFSCCGTLREVGFKFGQWLDLNFYQLLLETPDSPQDG